MKFTIKVWRQENAKAKGRFEQYELDGVEGGMSFLEMLDYLNSVLLERDIEPVAFDHDCREGICGCCGVVINGRPHGPVTKATTCELHMRSFKDGGTMVRGAWVVERAWRPARTRLRCSLWLRRCRSMPFCRKDAQRPGCVPSG